VEVHVELARHAAGRAHLGTRTISPDALEMSIRLTLLPSLPVLQSSRATIIASGVAWMSRRSAELEHAPLDEIGQRDVEALQRGARLPGARRAVDELVVARGRDVERGLRALSRETAGLDEAGHDRSIELGGRGAIREVDREHEATLDALDADVVAGA